MLSITIDGRSYPCPDQWCEVTLGDLASAEQLYAQAGGEVTDAFRSALLSLMCHISESVVERIETDQVRTFVDTALASVIALMQGECFHTAEHRESFRFQGTEYMLPRSGIDVLGSTIPMAEITTKEFCDASDIASTEKLLFAPLLVAILCRRRGESYCEERAKQRAAMFGELTADIYFDLLSMLSDTHAYMAAEYPKCYGTKEEPAESSAEPPSWGDRVLIVADNRPSELPIVEGMKAYDFIRLLNGKIKQMEEQWQIPRLF